MSIYPLWSSYRLHQALVLFLLLLPGWRGAVAAAGIDRSLTEPQAVVQRVSDGLMKVLREDRQLLRTDPTYVHRLVDELFLPNVDFERVSAIVMGKHWRRQC